MEIVYLQRKKLGACYRYKSVQSHDGVAEGLDIRQAWGWRPALLPRSGCVSELPFPQLENRKGVFPVGVLRGEVESFLSSPIDHIGDFSYCYKWYYINIWNLGL